METTAIRNTAVEACKILDALAVLSLDLSCHRHDKPDRMVLSAKRVVEVCEAIDSAVDSLKHILEITEAGGAGPLSSGMVRKIATIKGEKGK